MAETKSQRARVRKPTITIDIVDQQKSRTLNVKQDYAASVHVVEEDQIWVIK